jgi:hypothetical protein
MVIRSGNAHDSDAKKLRNMRHNDYIFNSKWSVSRKRETQNALDHYGNRDHDHRIAVPCMNFQVAEESRKNMYIQKN